MMYKVMFMQGRVFYVRADSESQALRKVIKQYPELASADILDIFVTKDVSEI